MRFLSRAANALDLMIEKVFAPPSPEEYRAMDNLNLWFPTMIVCDKKDKIHGVYYENGEPLVFSIFDPSIDDSDEYDFTWSVHALSIGAILAIATVFFVSSLTAWWFGIFFAIFETITTLIAFKIEEAEAFALLALLSLPAFFIVFISSITAGHMMLIRSFGFKDYKSTLKARWNRYLIDK